MTTMTERDQRGNGAGAPDEAHPAAVANADASSARRVSSVCWNPSVTLLPCHTGPPPPAWPIAPPTPRRTQLPARALVTVWWVNASGCWPSRAWMRGVSVLS